MVEKENITKGEYKNKRYIRFFGRKVTLTKATETFWICYKTYVTLLLSFFVIFVIDLFEIIFPEYILLTKFFVYSGLSLFR